MENQPFEDVYPFEHGDFPASHVRLRGPIILDEQLVNSRISRLLLELHSKWQAPPREV